MPAEHEIEEENRRHERTLRRLKEAFDHKEKELITAKDKENIDAEIFVGLAIVLEVIITLLILGEFITKATAVLAGCVVGIFALGIVIYVLYESSGDIIDIWKAYTRDRDAEDDRHDKALRD